MEIPEFSSNAMQDNPKLASVPNKQNAVREGRLRFRCRLVNSSKQRCLTSQWWCRLAN